MNLTERASSCTSSGGRWRASSVNSLCGFKTDPDIFRIILFQKLLNRLRLVKPNRCCIEQFSKDHCLKEESEAVNI